jgi:hypothetical protein
MFCHAYARSVIRVLPGVVSDSGGKTSVPAGSGRAELSTFIRRQ